MIRIVSDSSSNIYTLDGYEYKFVSLKIVTSVKQYVDEPGLDPNAMLEEIHAYKGRSGSSCPNVSEWLEAYEGADEIIAITISSNLSGSFNAAQQAADEYMSTHAGAKVYVIDSLSTGAGMHMLIDQVCGNISKGMSFDEVVASHKEYFPHVKMLFSLETLHNLAANGRVSPAIAALCGMLNIRVLSCASETGTIKALHKCRGDKKMLACMEKEMQESGFNGKRVRISHCQNKPIADAVTAFVKASYPDCEIKVLECTGLCSFYAQKGGILVSYEVN